MLSDSDFKFLLGLVIGIVLGAFLYWAAHAHF
jgi:hypothetical protein